MYNGLGSLLLLLVSVWFVDAFELFAIFLFRVSRCKVATKTHIKNKYTQHRHVVKAVLIGVLYFILLLSSAIIGYSKPRTRTIDVPLKQLPRCLDGYVAYSISSQENRERRHFPITHRYEIAMIADLHVGPLVGRAEVQRIVNRVNTEFDADAIVLVGDIGDQEVGSVTKTKLQPLGDLVARDGVFWTSGNHENMRGVQEYRDAMSALNVTVLENARRAVPILERRTNVCNVTFDLAALADDSGSGQNMFDDDDVLKPDLDAALLDRNESHALVLLNHQPIHSRKYAERGAGLILSGHTHGGQIWPQHMILLFSYDGVAGLFSIGSDSFLYVVFVRDTQIVINTRTPTQVRL